VLNPVPVPAFAEVMVAVKLRGVFRVAAVGDVIDVVRSGQTILTVHEITGAERAEVPHAFVASMV
jgi:hypothetical protein